jgi:hypothetical protein
MEVMVQAAAAQRQVELRSQLNERCCKVLHFPYRRWSGGTKATIGVVLRLGCWTLRASWWG